MKLLRPAKNKKQETCRYCREAERTGKEHTYSFEHTFMTRQLEEFTVVSCLHCRRVLDSVKE